MGSSGFWSAILTGVVLGTILVALAYGAATLEEEVTGGGAPGCAVRR